VQFSRAKGFVTQIAVGEDRTALMAPMPLSRWAANWRAPCSKSVMCVLFILLLAPPTMALGAHPQHSGRQHSLRYRRQSAAQFDTSSATRGVHVVPSSMRMRGGGADLHYEEVDVGNGKKVVVKAYKEGNAVTIMFTSNSDGFEVQWGVAIGQMDSWSHPKVCQICVLLPVCPYCVS